MKPKPICSQLLRALASHHFLHILNDPKFDIFYGAPGLVVISAAAGPWALADFSFAAENLMLAAHAAGLGTCWIGFAQGWLGTCEGKPALKLPETDIPLTPIIVGHPKSVPLTFRGNFRGLIGFRRNCGLSGIRHRMTTASPEPLHATKARETSSPERTKEATTSKRQRRRKTITVSWYGTLLIVGTLLVAAGWEIFRWILAIITLD
ncbi:nitroreductase family protein [Bradyrhizobium sp. CCBAU 051011]|uniref:nitroreductase family protein n=1 Tax=Bradyrhizobium sp. CCBAU 051011 TaxID=858422 RepID=UPI001FEFA4BD|nr:nitroreductase family protein [Bradyrhizobium sp. CCBAU 051011]